MTTLCFDWLINLVRKVKGPCPRSQKQKYFTPELPTLEKSPRRIQGPPRQQQKWKKKPHTTFSTIGKVEEQHFLYPSSFYELSDTCPGLSLPKEAGWGFAGSSRTGKVPSWVSGS